MKTPFIWHSLVWSRFLPFFLFSFFLFIFFYFVSTYFIEVGLVLVFQLFCHGFWSTFLFIFCLSLSVCLYVCLSVCLFVVHLPVYPFVRFSVCLFVCFLPSVLPIWNNISPSIYVSFSYLSCSHKLHSMKFFAITWPGIPHKCSSSFLTGWPEKFGYGMG